jgi:predicted ATP-dependent protease
MQAQLLQPQALALHCDPSTLDLGTRPSEAPDSVEIVGQERARAAIAFGIGMQQPGYHVFVMGPAGTGKRSLVRQAVEAHVASNGIRRSDWVYVNNFERPHEPIAIQLDAGRGAHLRADMRRLVDELRATIPAAFESEEYIAEAERINAGFKERTEQGMIDIGRQAHEQGLVMIRTPVGFTFAPRKGDEVMAPPEFEALPEAERTRLQGAVGQLQDQLVHLLRASVRLRKEQADRLRELDQATAKLAVDHAVDDVKTAYADMPAVLAHLEAVRAAVVDNAQAFRSREDGDAAPAQSELVPFEVNLLVDAAGSDGTALVVADMPTYQNLIGRVDHLAHFGMLVTDFRHIKPGLLHRANGGFLMIDAFHLLTQPFAWSALKRALLRNAIRIEPMADLLGLVSTVQLEPQPIPLDLKVVLVGERALWHLLQAHDPEFAELFHIVADVGEDMPRGADSQRALAQTLSLHAQMRQLLPPTPAALARLIDHAARRSGDARRVSAAVRDLGDVLTEADRQARLVPRAQIDASDVGAAIAGRRLRVGRVDERLRDAMMRDLLTIDTSGAVVGQVNGLAAYAVGDEEYGLPTRITATTRLGDGRVVDIQRETELGGPVHTKGVMILSSFLASRYARLRPHAINATLVFEQTYGLVEGDSASLAELVALLSSIGGVPVRQGFAVTGSVDQFGHVQAVGAVNEKVEGFFDLCVARGLDGAQGVVVPASNAAQLMLRDDVVAAAQAGRFAVYTARTVDEALEVLCGIPVGDAAVPADDTVNGRIARRLAEYEALRRGQTRHVRQRVRRGGAVVSVKEPE